jgi:hypothetical protein
MCVVDGVCIDTPSDGRTIAVAIFFSECRHRGCLSAGRHYDIDSAGNGSPRKLTVENEEDEQ